MVDGVDVVVDCLDGKNLRDEVVESLLVVFPPCFSGCLVAVAGLVVVDEFLDFADGEHGVRLVYLVEGLDRLVWFEVVVVVEFVDVAAAGEVCVLYCFDFAPDLVVFWVVKPVSL